MKHSLKGFPEYNGAQDIGLYLKQLYNWKEGFEKELRLRLGCYDDPRPQTEKGRALVRLLKEILGEF